MEDTGFRRLLELSDKLAREELEDYYIISSGCMNNYLFCLEDGASRIKQLEEENERLRKRDGNATVVLGFSDAEYPFNQLDLEVVDFGVSDNVYVVQMPSKESTHE